MTPNLLGRPRPPEKAARGRGGGVEVGTQEDRTFNRINQMTGLTIGCWNKSRAPFEKLCTKIGEIEILLNEHSLDILGRRMM